MKKKKNLWTAVAILSAAMLLGGCGGGESKEEDSGKIQETEETKEVETKETENAEAGAGDSGKTQPEETETAQQESVSILAASPHFFSEGYAWVQLEDANQLAVVDTDGKIQFTLEFADAGDVSAIEATPFCDGASAVYYNNGTYAIYSTLGELLASSDDGDDSTDIKLLGSGGGMYLIGKQTTTFSENSGVIYCIDKNGNKLTDEVTVGEVWDFGKFSYQNGFFYSFQYQYYVADGRLHTLGEEETLEEYMDAYFRFQGVEAEDGLTSSRLMDIYTYGFDRFIDCHAENPAEQEKAENMRQKVYMIDMGWYDRNGDLMLAPPAFPGGAYVVEVGNFQGGFAPIVLVGADGKLYYTVIDKTGSLVYDPVTTDSDVRIESVSRWQLYTAEGGGMIFHDGAIIVFIDLGGPYCVIDKDGTILELSEYYSTFTGSIQYGNNFAISEGFRYADDHRYWKLDGTPFDQAVMDENTVHVQFSVASAGN